MGRLQRKRTQVCPVALHHFWRLCFRFLHTPHCDVGWLVIHRADMALFLLWCWNNAHRSRHHRRLRAQVRSELRQRILLHLVERPRHRLGACSFRLRDGAVHDEA